MSGSDTTAGQPCKVLILHLHIFLEIVQYMKYNDNIQKQVKE